MGYGRTALSQMEHDHNETIKYHELAMHDDATFCERYTNSNMSPPSHSQLPHT